MSLVNRVRVYIKPFDTLGNYVPTWTEVTDDVIFDDIGDIQQDLDNTDYTLGVFRTNSVALTMKNEFGLYSDVDVLQSIFRWRRAGSLVKFVWDIEYDGNYCGTAVLGDAYLTDGSEKILFTGLLDDSSLALNLTDRKQQFQVLGRESIFDSVTVPYASLGAGTDHTSVLIYKMLNQNQVTAIVTIDAANINPGRDQIPDDITGLENKTVKEALDELLLYTNSVLYINGDTVFVGPRTAGASVSYTFHGQGSETAHENIISIENLKNGMARTFNYLNWKNTTILVYDNSSVTHYGAIKKEFDVAMFTDATKQTNILNDILAEFKDPKTELDLISDLNYDTFGISLLNRIAIDYPTIYVSDGDPLPIVGIAVIGVAVIPKGLWNFTMGPSTPLKVIGRKIGLKTGLLTLKLRKI